MSKSLKDLLPLVVPKPDSWKIFLFQRWETIIGDLNVQVSLEKIQKETLILTVPNASWMQELHCLSDILIKKINENLEHPYVKSLKFKCAPRIKRVVKEQISKKQIFFEDVPLSIRQKKALERIDDHHLALALKKFFARCHYTSKL